MTTRRRFLQTLAGLSGALGASAALPGIEVFQSSADAQEAQGTSRTIPSKPNFVLIVADDMGYGDWSGAGHPTIRTPNLERMAAEGLTMSQFYAGNPVCSPSRASLLTGRNNIRTGVIEVFIPVGGHGLPLSEITLPQALKPLGYTSACIGKWHLGSGPEYRPLERGFDEFFGLLYSNDMYSPDLYHDDEVIEHPANQDTLTKRYTQQAVSFIERNQDRPFFLYLPHTMPHTPLAASQEFRGKSPRGLYGDTIEEIDFSVGQVLDTLNGLGLSEKTLVIFSSDNGPWVSQKQDGGSSGLFSGAKGNTWEGGMRVPGLFRWKGTLKGGSRTLSVGSFIDIFPTFLALAGGQTPNDRPIDGTDLSAVLFGGESPERTIYYYRGARLSAVRKGKWKLHLRYYDLNERRYDILNAWIQPKVPLLFDLEADPSEKFDLASEHPDIAQDLLETARSYEAEIERLAENQDLIKWFQREWPAWQAIHQGMKGLP
jgi:arylsulfatase A-like enzyme